MTSRRQPKGSSRTQLSEITIRLILHNWFSALRHRFLGSIWVFDSGVIDRIGTFALDANLTGPPGHPLRLSLCDRCFFLVSLSLYVYTYPTKLRISFSKSTFRGWQCCFFSIWFIHAAWDRVTFCSMNRHRLKGERKKSIRASEKKVRWIFRCFRAGFFFFFGNQISFVPLNFYAIYAIGRIWNHSMLLISFALILWLDGDGTEICWTTLWQTNQTVVCSLLGSFTSPHVCG